MSDSSQIRDTFEIARVMSRDIGHENYGVIGYGIIELYHEDGSLGLVSPFANLVTDYGDLYYATRAVSGVNTNGISNLTNATGMQIGSGTTTPAKAGAGGAMVTFLAGVVFDPTYPQLNNLGAGLGVEAVYKTTFPAGTGTGTVQEATVTNGTISTASTAGNTIGRILTGAVVKAAGDVLAITWRQKFLGA